MSLPCGIWCNLLGIRRGQQGITKQKHRRGRCRQHLPLPFSTTHTDKDSIPYVMSPETYTAVASTNALPRATSCNGFPTLPVIGAAMRHTVSIATCGTAIASLHPQPLTCS